MEKKVVTINRLLEILPPGTADPTPFSYDTMLYTMAVLYTGAWATNMLVKPLDPSLHSKPPPEPEIIESTATEVAPVFAEKLDDSK